MRLFPLFLVLVAGTAAAQDWTPSDTHLAMHRALSARHFDGDCARIEALSKTPVETLSDLVEHAKSPPWVPMRAASCLVKGHPEAIRADLDRWVTDPDLLGLGIQTLAQIDLLPEEIALDVARRAVAEGPVELDARARVLKSERAAVRAVVEGQ